MCLCKAGTGRFTAIFLHLSLLFPWNIIVRLSCHNNLKASRRVLRWLFGKCFIGYLQMTCGLGSPSFLPLMMDLPVPTGLSAGSSPHVGIHPRITHRPQDPIGFFPVGIVPISVTLLTIGKRCVDGLLP